ncbi:hypothetical protein CTAM01_10433 [Colletotrichum tamarilloi]|uniref:Uncharacterized protein n=1 Tax=Colletotrichum tamarilloi TaxID=1209934 RepID=A0ABQ9R0I5_9PEZI|nr:uncharacterized protein CTAM01_10433 [Colletotrichum tamarilloi]KAI3549909.1 hypothetical protein CSPX01_02084 [Colletotrichum filicis]KAK1490940.1 hypothetical protein CTAM01_10433 [Colletotrichum tamarilloi]
MTSHIGDRTAAGSVTPYLPSSIFGASFEVLNTVPMDQYRRRYSPEFGCDSLRNRCGDGKFAIRFKRQECAFQKGNIIIFRYSERKFLTK